ncbi:3-oxoacyl-[acyl-carrier protein] reductase [Actinocorallia herbida]|uniref:3-oxoacyl-[acyl-carrier protein] reductase n=1 Tax=Actinocorallia herbida TaxID=58109 RepID=A0A3N1CVP0_9ACTN|nr:SDR family NAD(P)-dependent oxidoreductase [Actinocorallia herbida]ROO85304.1 3-oxoacyl-[acyl-carrier protein] reductase [Actinocorallia herbida]
MPVAVVTGGGRGIGAAVSRRLARDGYAVAVNYSRSRADAEAVVAGIEAAGGRAVALGADVGRAEEAAALIERTTELLGTPTVLVNNAGVNHSGSARRQAPEEFDRVLAVNLHGAYYCTHAALPGMYEEGRGRVVFFGSPSGGRDIVPTMGAYAAAKAGLAAMAKVIAKETARRGVTVNTVVPGFVETDMVRSAGDKALENLKATWPEIPAEAVASTVSFLVSDEAAYVSGEEIGVWLGGPVSA